MKCQGCQHHNARFETCTPLGGELYCGECCHRWSLTDSVSCPRCASLSTAVDLSNCENGPSVACPGRVEVEPEKVQGSLF